MTHKIKIVYCTDDLSAAGGMQKVLTLKANYLAEKLGYDVTIITTDQKDNRTYFPLSTNIKLVNLQINFYDMYNRTPFVLRLWKYLLYMKKYKRLLTQTLHEIKPDITITLLRKEINFINSIKDGSYKIGEIHFDKTHYRVFHHPLIPSIFCRLITYFWKKQLIKKLQLLDRFIVLTNEDRQKWTELESVDFIHNPIDLSDINGLSALDNKTVIAIGRYTYQKGFDRLLKAWNIVSKKHPDWRLTVYGGGDKTVYEKMVHELNINKTCQLNENTPQIIHKLKESSIFVLSSRYEGFGLVLVEAMACGVPPIAFDCPCGPKDIITPMKDGILVENGNIDQLANKINYLIEHPDVNHQMGIEATISAKRFDISEIMKKWDLLFNHLISKKSCN